MPKKPQNNNPNKTKNPLWFCQLIRPQTGNRSGLSQQENTTAPGAWTGDQLVIKYKMCRDVMY